jgi:hypothetical protein
MTYYVAPQRKDHTLAIVVGMSLVAMALAVIVIVGIVAAMMTMAHHEQQHSPAWHMGHDFATSQVMQGGVDEHACNWIAYGGPSGGVNPDDYYAGCMAGIQHHR